MTKIIGVAGKKRAGKNTVANFLHGYVLRKKGVIKDFALNDTGELIVNALYLEPDGSVKEELGVLDLTQQNDAFYGYADQMIWPHIKLYHFADPLKEICMSMFGLTHEQVYGNSKNSSTKLNWKNMPGVITTKDAKTALSKIDKKWENASIEEIQAVLSGVALVKEPILMTAREVMQYVGTDIFRKMNNKVWTDLTLNKIREEAPEIAVIADCRFDNEAEAIRSNEGIVVKLTRDVTKEDSHESESGFQNFVFDIVVDNQKMSIKDANYEVLNKLITFGVPELS
jgi:hypothetical protein